MLQNEYNIDEIGSDIEISEHEEDYNIETTDLDIESDIPSESKLDAFVSYNFSKSEMKMMFRMKMMFLFCMKETMTTVLHDIVL